MIKKKIFLKLYAMCIKRVLYSLENISYRLARLNMIFKKSNIHLSENTTRFKTGFFNFTK